MRTVFGFFITVLTVVFTTGAFAATDDFDFSNFAITESGDADLTTSDVALNPGAEPVTVNNFDIAGIMLGMSFDDVDVMFLKSRGLYAPREKDAIIYSIQKEWKYNLDYECRQQGIFAPTELEQCINTLAKNRGLLYAAELHLLRENTGETIVVYFTSNASDNVVWRVLYNNDVNEIEGDHEKFADQREKKILAFWQAVLDKYGAPNSGTDKWISTTNAYDPVMTAYYGSLDLVDNGLYASDMAKNVQQARENFQSKPYAF